MRFNRSIVLFASASLLLAGSGCKKSSMHAEPAMAEVPTTKPKFSDCKPAEPLVDRTGYVLAPRATYKAQQVPGQVIIMVEGETPTPGYAVVLSMNPARIYPPQFTLYQKPPAGMVAQVLTPFDLCVTFGADTRSTVGEITIYDADGAITVPVEKVLD